MRSHTLAIYSLKFKEKNGAYKNLVEMLEILGKCLSNKLGKIEKIEDASKIYRIIIRVSTPNEIGGIIETGNYGTSEPIIDINSGNEDYKKKLNDADLEPHYFLLLSRGLTKESGFFISERLGSDGVENILKGRLEACLNNINVETKSPMGKEEAKRIIEELKEVKLIKYIPNKEIVREIRQEMNEEGLILELRIRPEKNKFLPSIFERHIRAFLENSNTKGIFLVTNDIIKSASKENGTPTLDFDYFETKIHLGGTERTVRMAKNDAIFRPYFLMKEVPEDENGWPKFEAIDEYAKKLANDFIREKSSES